MVPRVRKGWRRFKVVEVAWSDTLTIPDWDDSWGKRLQRWEKAPPIVAYTYGVLLQRTKDHVVIAGTMGIAHEPYTAEYSSANDITFIPTSMIKSGRVRVKVLGYHDFPLDIGGEGG